MSTSAPSPSGRLMVAYIATDGGIDALRLAIAIARGRNLSIDIVMAAVAHEVTPGIYPADRSFGSILEQQFNQWLTDALAEVPADVPATGHVAVGESIPETLIAKAQELGSDVMVVGAQGGGIFKRFSLGTVVNALLHSCPIPLALAPRGYNEPGPLTRISTMVGPLPGATDVFSLGVARAAKRGIPLRVVSLAIEGETPLASASATAGGAGSRPDGAGEDILAALTPSLPVGIAADAEKLKSADALSTEVAAGKSVEAAVNTVSWQPGEVVFLGSSRLGTKGRLFLGATATQILRHIPVPTVAVPKGYMTTANAKGGHLP